MPESAFPSADKQRPPATPTSSNLLSSKVVEEEIGRGIVRHKGVHESVAIVVGKADAHALAQRAAIPVSCETSVNVPSPLLR